MTRPILLVEDNKINRDLAMRRLQIHGFEMIAAVDGQEAVELAVSHLPGLILMDISLPIKDGWTATTELKSDSATSNIPVIAVTAHALPEDRDKATEIGFDGFHPKPINFAKLIEEIEQLRLAD